jgi:hypothetical protein
MTASQRAMQCFESKDGKAKIFVENDMAIGLFHDFLMEMKGTMVEKMIVAHKEQIDEMEKHKSITNQEAPCESSEENGCC